MDEKQRRILTREELPKLTEFADQVVTITGIEGWYKSGYGEYAKVRLEESLDLVIAGNKAVVPKLRALEEIDGFPITVLIKPFKTPFGSTGVKLADPEGKDEEAESHAVTHAPD